MIQTVKISMHKTKVDGLPDIYQAFIDFGDNHKIGIGVPCTIQELCLLRMERSTIPHLRKAFKEDIAIDYSDLYTFVDYDRNFSEE